MARQLAETAVAQSKDLRLDENHIVIESKAAEVLWLIDPLQARALFQNVLARLDSEDSAGGSSDDEVRQRRLALRRRILQTSANYDPQLTLDTLSRDTRSNAEMAQYRRQIELDLATQLAQKEPGRALKLAEKNLGDEVAHQYAPIISAVWQSDPRAAAEFSQAVVTGLRGSSAQSQQRNIYPALNLFSTLAQIEESTQAGQKGKSTATRPSLVPSLQDLADFVASSALDPQNQQIVFLHLLNDTDRWERYAPGKFAAVKSKLAEWKRRNPETVSNEEFNRILSSANVDEQLQAAAKAPAQNRQQFYQQIAWNALNRGDVEGARRVILQDIAPAERAQMLSQLARQAALQAASRGDISAARAYVVESTGAANERATFLAEVVTSAGDKLSKAQALALLEEAASWLSSPLETEAELNASLEVAGAFALVDSRRAGRMLEDVGDRINDVINGLAPIDGFLPTRSFEGGELLLESGYVSNSLISAYATAAATLARQDTESSRTVAEKIQRPEARAQVLLEMALDLANSARTGDAGIASFSHGRRYAYWHD
ncbi:MAG: hypothetical protein L0Z53_12970 [Acidobacteriales bacterium]|nr:hypothetical protein [Terriglobales bacterium]